MINHHLRTVQVIRCIDEVHLKTLRATICKYARARDSDELIAPARSKCCKYKSLISICRVRQVVSNMGATNVAVEEPMSTAAVQDMDNLDSSMKLRKQNTSRINVPIACSSVSSRAELQRFVVSLTPW